MSTTYQHRVPILGQPKRLQDYGVAIFEQIPTKSALKKALKKGLLTVNGVPAVTATLINGGELLEFNPIPAKSHKVLELPLEVLYEDAYLAAVNKPAGILVSGNRHKTIANALGFNLTPSALSDACLPQPVHRLDFPTTGVLLVGKTSESIRELNKIFENRELTKTYTAVTVGNMPSKGSITMAIDLKQANTNYKVIGTTYFKELYTLNLVSCQPVTGRRHQLRKHFSALGNPILGDKEYGQQPLALNAKGLFLHASNLSFLHPFTGKLITIEAPLPKKFCKYFNKIYKN